MPPEEPSPGLDRVCFQLRADGVPAENTNPLRSGIHHRGYLPHVKREGAAYFVTFRLCDSLPKEVLLRFLGEKAERLRALPNFTLSEILKGRKQYTAKQANRILDRPGETFWQTESFDHWIRNDAEKARIRRYIRGNPTKAGLCASPEEWRWGSAWGGAAASLDATDQ